MKKKSVRQKNNLISFELGGIFALIALSFQALSE